MNEQPFLLCEAPVIPKSSKDYYNFSELLKNINTLLDKTGAEKRLIDLALVKFNKEKSGKSPGWTAQFRNSISFIIRCNLVRRLRTMNYRAFSVTASDSKLVQWFIRRGQLEGFTEELSGKGLSKSSLERYDKILSAEDIEAVIYEVCASVSAKEWAGNTGWNQPLSVQDIFVDCTCLESNIHFPVDWILMRDVVRTLSLSIDCIRRHGLKHRIKNPELFIREINQLCIEMSGVSRSKKDSKNKRKRVFRKMKAVVKCVERHAIRYQSLLVKQRTSLTDFTQAEADQVLKRIESVLSQIPSAIKQAEDRIIREQKVADSEKTLSLYNPDISTIFRGKAGSAIEFGNTLYLAESSDGLIVDFKLHKDRAPADCRMVEESLTRCKKAYGGINSITADRGFHSPENTQLLAKEKAINNILNKSPRLMAESFKDPSFRAAQKRRAQTEGRIGILKNVFLGDCLMGKSFEH